MAVPRERARQGVSDRPGEVASLAVVDDGVKAASSRRTPKKSPNWKAVAIIESRQKEPAPEGGLYKS